MTTAPAGSPPATRPPLPVLLLGAGALLLLVGPFLPWVTVGGVFDVSGVRARWGYFPLVIGALTVYVLFARLHLEERATVMWGAILMGVIPLGVAVFFGLALRDNIAEAAGPAPAAGEDPLEEFGASIAEAFKPSTGAGVYVTGAGGVVLVLAGAVMIRRPAPFDHGATMTTTAQVRFFAREMFSPPTLLRRTETDGTDEAFVNGQWVPTKAIVDWMFGSDDFVTEISESQARKLAPAAFAIRP